MNCWWKNLNSASVIRWGPQSSKRASATGLDVSQTSYIGSVPYMSHQKEALEKTQESLERLYRLVSSFPQPQLLPHVSICAMQRHVASLWKQISRIIWTWDIPLPAGGSLEVQKAKRKSESLLTIFTPETDPVLQDWTSQVETKSLIIVSFYKGLLASESKEVPPDVWELRGRAPEVC